MGKGELWENRENKRACWALISKSEEAKEKRLQVSFVHSLLLMYARADSVMFHSISNQNASSLSFPRASPNQPSRETPAKAK